MIPDHWNGPVILLSILVVSITHRLYSVARRRKDERGIQAVGDHENVAVNDIAITPFPVTETTGDGKQFTAQDSTSRSRLVGGTGSPHLAGGAVRRRRP